MGFFSSESSSTSSARDTSTNVVESDIGAPILGAGSSTPNFVGTAPAFSFSAGEDLKSVKLRTVMDSPTIKASSGSNVVFQPFSEEVSSILGQALSMVERGTDSIVNYAAEAEENASDLVSETLASFGGRSDQNTTRLLGIGAIILAGVVIWKAVS